MNHGGHTHQRVQNGAGEREQRVMGLAMYASGLRCSAGGARGGGHAFTTVQPTSSPARRGTTPWASPSTAYTSGGTRGPAQREAGTTKV